MLLRLVGAVSLAFAMAFPAVADSVTAYQISVSPAGRVSIPDWSGSSQAQSEALRRAHGRREHAYTPVRLPEGALAYSKASASVTPVRSAARYTLNGKTSKVFKVTSTSVLEYLQGVTPKQVYDLQYNMVDSVAEPTVAVRNDDVLITN